MGTHAEVRVLVYPNKNRLRPADASRIRRILASRGVRPVIVRVAPAHVEVEIPSHLVQEAIEAGLDILGSTPSEISGAHSSSEDWADAFLELSRKQRFWEAHTAAEAGWRIAGLPWAQALAAAAAALAKAQEGLIEPARRMAAKSAAIAERTGARGLVDPACVEEEAVKACSGSEAMLERCIDWSRVKGFNRSPLEGRST